MEQVFGIERMHVEATFRGEAICIHPYRAQYFYDPDRGLTEWHHRANIHCIETYKEVKPRYVTCILANSLREALFEPKGDNRWLGSPVYAGPSGDGVWKMSSKPIVPTHAREIVGFLQRTSSGWIVAPELLLLRKLKFGKNDVATRTTCMVENSNAVVKYEVLTTNGWIVVESEQALLGHQTEFIVLPEDISILDI